MSSTFTIEQTPDDADLYIYPDSAGWITQHTAQGAANNWDCVNEARDVPDEDTYVYTVNPSTVSDLYAFKDPTLTTETINYLTLYSRTKSHQYAQSGSGLFKLLLSTTGTPQVYASDDINLTTDYSLYDNTWTSNPSNSNAWIWGDISHIQMGVESSSPAVTLANLTLTLRPNAAGYMTNLTPVPSAPATNWDKVDDTTPDYTATYVNTTSTSHTTDLYALPNHTTETGTIDDVTVYILMGGSKDSTGAWVKSVVSCGTTISYGDEYFHVGDNWIYYSHTWTVNPDDSLSWQWGDIDGLQIGVSIKTWVTTPRCTQVYAVVNYRETINPEIRTTQCYGKVNYTPSTSTCYLNKPHTYTFTHTREIRAPNFFGGDREVYDLRKAGNTLAIEGSEYDTTDSTATTRLECIRDMADNGDDIEISGFTDTNINGSWLIRNFSYAQDSTNPNLWNYSMECERT